MLKMRLFLWFVMEKKLIQTSCNLIYWEHFGLNLRSKIFTGNNKNFHYRINSVKINDQFFFKFKKPNFWRFFPISPFFWEKKFPPKIGLSCITSYGFLAPCKKFREIYWSNSKKTSRQMTGGKDGHTLFHRILPATTRGLTSTTAVDWHLKVHDIFCWCCWVECWSNQKLLNHNQHAKNQLNSYTHSANFRVS